MPPQHISTATTTMAGSSPSPTPQTGNAARAQYRRQGSSYGAGHVHHMAVMVAPTRVDYSVNKGGIRSWVVLIVFVLLCSALLNIFSEEPGTRTMSMTTSKGEDVEFDEEANDWSSKRSEINETEEENESESKHDDARELETEEGEEEDDEIDDDEKKDISYKYNVNEEELMLARLREKAAKRWREHRAERRKAQKIGGTHDELIHDSEEKNHDGGEEKDENQNEIGKQDVIDDEEMEAETDRHNHIMSTEVGTHQEQEEENQQPDTDEPFEAVPKRKIAQKKRSKTTPTSKKHLLSHSRQQKEQEGRRPRKELLRKQPQKRKLEAIMVAEDEENERFEENATANDQENAQIQAEETIQTNEVVALRKRPVYNRKAITNRNDYRHRELLDAADFMLEQHNFVAAAQQYQQVLSKDPDSPRALFGRARMQQLSAEFSGPDNELTQAHLLEKAMTDYEQLLNQDETPDELFRIAAQHFIECARHRGSQQHKIIQVQRALVDRFPDDLDAQCEFGVTWLGMRRPEEAANVFKNILDSEPSHAVAQAYYGYILMVHEENLERGVQLLRRAIRSGRTEVTEDPKFYFHLGDGLTRLGRKQEALSVYADAVSHGLFPSTLQRSMHNMKGLTARPWWTLEQTGCGKQLRQLERHWTAIREEALQIWNKRRNLFVQENAMHLINPSEHWVLVFRGNSHGNFREDLCERWMPSTCELLKAFSNSMCAREKIRLSVLHAGASSWPHCGSTNYVLEAHLGLVASSDARLRVGQETKGWRQGKMFVFDTSFERELMFEGAPANAVRIALVLELWHPELPQMLREKISDDMEDNNENISQ